LYQDASSQQSQQPRVLDQACSRVLDRPQGFRIEHCRVSTRHVKPVSCTAKEPSSILKLRWPVMMSVCQCQETDIQIRQHLALTAR
jgi:hypothetical protein